MPNEDKKENFLDGLDREIDEILEGFNWRLDFTHFIVGDDKKYKTLLRRNYWIVYDVSNSPERFMTIASNKIELLDNLRELINQRFEIWSRK